MLNIFLKMLKVTFWLSFHEKNINKGKGKYENDKKHMKIKKWDLTIK